MLIVFGHFQHALAWHIAAAQDVFQERKHVVRALRPTERYHQHCIVRIDHAWHSVELDAAAPPDTSRPGAAQ
jgi:hypothetical protein